MQKKSGDLLRYWGACMPQISHSYLRSAEQTDLSESVHARWVHTGGVKMSAGQCLIFDLVEAIQSQVIHITAISYSYQHYLLFFRERPEYYSKVKIATNHGCILHGIRFSTWSIQCTVVVVTCIRTESKSLFVQFLSGIAPSQNMTLTVRIARLLLHCLRLTDEPSLLLMEKYQLMMFCDVPQAKLGGKDSWELKMKICRSQRNLCLVLAGISSSRSVLSIPNYFKVNTITEYMQ